MMKRFLSTTLFLCVAGCALLRGNAPQFDWGNATVYFVITDRFCNSDWHPFSYLNNSYHRDADMDNMVDCAVTFLLAPGAVQIFYGDETRRGLSDARLNVDSDQAFRSDMNWSSVDSVLLRHYRKLGQIRRDNPVIGKGRQRTFDTHTCLRYDDRDSLLIRLLPEAGKAIDLHGTFRDGDTLTELYTGQTATVRNGRVSFPDLPTRVAILKRK